MSNNQTRKAETMTAKQQLLKLGELFNATVKVVRGETDTLDAAQALMAKWGEGSVESAISREAKSRAIKMLAN